MSETGTLSRSLPWQVRFMAVHDAVVLIGLLAAIVTMPYIIGSGQWQFDWRVGTLVAAAVILFMLLVLYNSGVEMGIALRQLVAYAVGLLVPVGIFMIIRAHQSDGESIQRQFWLVGAYLLMAAVAVKVALSYLIVIPACQALKANPPKDVASQLLVAEVIFAGLRWVALALITVGMVLIAGLLMLLVGTICDKVLEDFAASAHLTYGSSTIQFFGPYLPAIVKAAIWGVSVGWLLSLTGDALYYLDEKFTPIKARPLWIVAAIVLILVLLIKPLQNLPLYLPLMLILVAAVSTMFMRTKIFIIALREWRSLFTTPIAYLIATVFLLVQGLVFFWWSWGSVEILAEGRPFPLPPALPFFLNLVSIILIVVLLPLITMRTLAEEKRTGSIEVLLTAPISDWNVVLGKYLASVALYLFLWIPTLAYMAVLARAGTLDWGPVAASYLCVALMGIIFCAVGIWFSALTKNQVIAAICTTLFIAFAMFVFLLRAQADSTNFLEDARWLLDVMLFMGPGDHLQAMGTGIVDSRHLLFYVIWTPFFLFVAVKALEARKWSSFNWAAFKNPVVLIISAGGLILLAVASYLLITRLENGLFAAVGVTACLIVYLLLIGRVWGGSSTSHMVYGSNVIIHSIIFLVLTGLLSFLALRHYTFLDWTATKVHSLSQRSVQMLEGLDGPLKIHVLIANTAIPETDAQYTDNMRLQILEGQLQFYQRASSKVQVNFINPFRDKAKVDEITESTSGSGNREVIVEYGEKKALLTDDDLFDLQANPFAALTGQGGERQPGPKENFEGVFTQAILTVTELTKRRIYFSIGHGERDLDNADVRNPDGFALFRQALGRQNLDVDRVNLGTAEKVPDDCKLLIVAGPRYPYRSEEAEKLRGYLDGGGRIIVLLDARSESGLNDWLAQYQITVNNDSVQRAVQDLFGRVTISEEVMQCEFALDHPLGAKFKGRPTEFLGVLSLDLPPQPPPMPPGQGPPPEPWQRTPLIVAPEGYWSQNDLDAKDEKTILEGIGKKSPFPIAALYEQGEFAPPVGGMGMGTMGGAPPPTKKISSKGPKLLVVGDADFASNPQWNLPRNVNSDFAMACVNYLIGRDALVDIGPKERTLYRFNTSAVPLTALKWIFVLVFPLATLVAGTSVWVARRH